MKRSLDETIQWRLGHIRQQIARCQDLEERGYDAFMEDWALQAAAKDTLETIGEAVAGMQDAAGLTGNDMPEPLNTINLPWSAMKRFRDKASHRYYELDYSKQIWAFLENNIPDLESELDKVCDREGNIFPKQNEKLHIEMLKKSVSVKNVCGSRNTVDGEPCQHPPGCSIKGH